MAAAALAVAAWRAGSTAGAQEPAGSRPETEGVRTRIDAARSALERYYETQQLHSKEQGDWKLAKEILSSRIDLLGAQIADLEARTEEESGKITTADEERTGMVEQLGTLDAVRDLQVQRLQELEKRVRRIAALAPGPLASKIEPLVDRLPDLGADPGEIKASDSERFQNVLGILNAVTEFHRNVTVTRERRKLEDGREVEVTALYLGLGIAYFRGGGEEDPVAGFGQPSEYGWRWTETPGSIEAINRLVDIYEGKAVAEFLEVPARIQ